MIRERRLSDVCAAGRVRSALGGGQAAPATGDGFTLIEVLMAAFVLALGVLGLSAMFAGAARQQQLASQQTRSVTVSQSADAMISENLGKLGTLDRTIGPDQVTVYGSERAYPGRWFVIPVQFEGPEKNGISYMSINPGEDWSDPNSSLFFRTKPNQQLPRLIYRATPNANNQILVGQSGTNPQTRNDELGMAPFTAGAPSFDGSFGVARVISDSVQVRVVTLGYACSENLQRRNLTDAVPETITFTLDPSYQYDLTDRHLLLGSDGVSLMLIDQQIDVMDSEFAANPSTEAARILLMDVEDVLGGESDVNCDGHTDYVEVSQGGQNVYNDGQFSAVGPDRFDVASAGGQSVYRLGSGGTADLLNASDADYDVPQNAQVLVSGRGPYKLTPPGTLMDFKVKPIDANWRYVSEIWIDSFEYRGHRVVSADDRVWYTKDPSRESGRRADMAYSILYRDLGTGAGAQYIVFTYSLRPSSASSDYVPPERAEDIPAGDSPVTLVEDVVLEYDDEIGRYYIELSEDDPYKWLAEPGQIIVFAGDPASSPAFYGADGPVGIQFRREDAAGGKVRGYLESAPRVGNQSLLEAAPGGSRFDVWAVQPTVTSLDDSGAEWGLRPIEARVFEVFEN